MFEAIGSFMFIYIDFCTFASKGADLLWVSVLFEIGIGWPLLIDRKGVANARDFVDSNNSRSHHDPLQKSVKATCKGMV